ncbi:MAG TPA: oxidoreductase [Bacteroidetes bacterium]|nr:oxidoreductase [Bacteroidota bacterium]
MNTHPGGEVLQITALTPSVRIFRIRYSLSNAFRPGQFVMLDLPIQTEFTTRSYSIASAPNSDGWIELCIVKKPDGPGTSFLFEHIKEGDMLQVSEPQGKFVLEAETAPLCMVCTGTGIAPFRAMILDLRRRHTRLPMPLTLVFGNRFEEDILYREEWEQMQKLDPNFKFIPVLSREENWNGAKGYVHESYLPLAKAYPETHFYLCGWTTMVRDAKNKLKALGFSRKQLKFELYD